MMLVHLFQYFVIIIGTVNEINIYCIYNTNDPKAYNFNSVGVYLSVCLFCLLSIMTLLLVYVYGSHFLCHLILCVCRLSIPPLFAPTLWVWPLACYIMLVFLSSLSIRHVLCVATRVHVLYVSLYMIVPF